MSHLCQSNCVRPFYFVRRRGGWPNKQVMFDLSVRANSQRAQQKTLLHLSALFLRPFVSVTTIIRFCSWPMRARGTGNVYIHFVSAEKCCCRGQQPASNGLLWIGWRILCLSTCLSTLFSGLWEHVCVTQTWRHCVSVCVFSCWLEMRKMDRADETQRTDKANICPSLFLFCLPGSSPLLHPHAPRLWSSVIYAQTMVWPVMGEINAHLYTKRDCLGRTTERVKRHIYIYLHQPTI